MKTRLLNAWEALRSSLWFVPSLMIVSAAALAFGTVALDAHVNSKLARTVSWLWFGSPDGARALLSASSSSVMTVAGVVFSITVTSLTLASSQFGPRLLRNFMRDTGNQVVLGTFIATFVYCLLVLRTVRSTNEGNFVPYISVTVGMLLTVTSLCVLVYFIHHVAGSIQAENVAAAVGREVARGHRGILRGFRPRRAARWRVRATSGCTGPPRPGPRARVRLLAVRGP